MKKINNLETERLTIRAISTEDAEFILELYNSPKFIEFIGDRNIKNTEMQPITSSKNFFHNTKSLDSEIIWLPEKATEKRSVPWEFSKEKD